MCIQPCFSKNIFSLKNQGINKSRTSSNFIVLSKKNFKSFCYINPPTPLSHDMYQICRRNYKISVTISHCFPIIYGQETFLIPCPQLLCISKEAYSKVNVIKNILEND